MNTPQLTLSTRRYDLDWLRVLAFALLIFYHTGMFFVEWEWHIKNNMISKALEWPMMFASQWRMSLLFIISGAATFFILEKLPTGPFMWERTKRLFFPLVFGMFVIIPPQIYFERLYKGSTYSYAEFYPDVLNMVPFPEGSFSWHHLWYICYIFVYSLVFLPLLLWLRSESGKKVTTRIGRLFTVPVLLYGLALFQFVIEISLKDAWEPKNNLIQDWYNHGIYGGFFLIGFLLCTQNACWQAVENQRKWSLGLGLLTVTVLYAFYWIGWKDLTGTDLVVYRLIKSFNRWFWLLTLLGFAKRYLSFNSPALQYANQAVYPFYILHQTVIICIAYPLINLAWGVAPKFALIVVLTFASCWILFEGLIKHWNVTRFLFGLKPLLAKQNALNYQPDVAKTDEVTIGLNN